MNTNDKTLAGVQPGGAVRLGDALLPCPFCGAPAERIDFGFGSGENEGGSCIACTVCQHSGPIEFGFKESFVSNWNRRAHSARQPAGHQHADDLAVDAFAAAMKAKMAAARAKGRGGWEDPEQCSADDLTRMLRDHVEKGDPRDVANFCMMLHQRGEAIAADQQTHQEPVAVVGHDLTLHWIGKGSIAPLVKRHGIGPGSKLYSAPLAQAVAQGPTVIPDTPEVRDILGRPNFWCSRWANVLRVRGDAIPRKAEEEQAAVTRFMLNHYLAHGAEWAETAGAELNAIRKADCQAVGNG